MESCVTVTTRSSKPSEPSMHCLQVQTADASAATETLEALSSDERYWRSRIAVDLQRERFCFASSIEDSNLQHGFRFRVHHNGSIGTLKREIDVPVDLKREITNKRYGLSEASVEVSRSEQTSPTLAALPTSTLKQDRRLHRQRAKKHR